MPIHMLERYMGRGDMTDLRRDAQFPELRGAIALVRHRRRRAGSGRLLRRHKAEKLRAMSVAG
jgi:hypothetical protein